MSSNDLQAVSTEDGINAEIEALAHALAEAAWDRKALDLEIINVSGLVSYADYFVLCTGRSDRQVQAIAAGIESDLRESGYRPRGVEGVRQGMWVLMDFGDIVVHIFHHQEREKYSLERLWNDAPRLPVDIPEGLTSKEAGLSE